VGEHRWGLSAGALGLPTGAGFGGKRVPLSTLVNMAADATPGGRSLLNTLWYDPKEWVRQAHIKDVMQKTLGIDVGDVGKIARSAAKGEDITPLLREARMKAEIRIKGAPVVKEPFTVNFDTPPGAAVDKAVDQKIAALSAKDP